MVRRMIRSNEEACTGCGACAEASHEGAITMIDGKAKLTQEDFCDGLDTYTRVTGEMQKDAARNKSGFPSSLPIRLSNIPAGTFFGSIRRLIRERVFC